MAPMTWRRCAAGVVLGVAVLLTQALAVGPPPAGPVKLTREQLLRINKARYRMGATMLATRMGESLRFAQEVESLRRQWQGPRHWETIDAQDDVEQAMRYVRLAPAAQKEVARIARLHRILVILLGGGQHAEAEKVARATLDITQKALGEEHPDTGVSHNHLAACLLAQGKAAEARPLFEKALAIRRKALGESHRDTALGYANLAACLDAEGQTARAIPYFEKALAIGRVALGEVHPLTVTQFHGLANCLVKAGQHARALPLRERALAICRKVWGEVHPETATSYDNYASSLYNMGHYSQAQLLSERALEIRRKALGEQHADTASAYDGVAVSLLAQGKVVQALPLLEKALAISRQVNGEGHEQTARQYTHLAACLLQQGKYSQAERQAEKAVTIFARLGAGTIADEINAAMILAMCLMERGRLHQTQSQLQKTLALARERLGQEHRMTAVVHHNLAHCLSQLGKHEEALALYEKALAILSNALPADHPELAPTTRGIAQQLEHLNRHAQALPLHEKALQARRKMLGEAHPLTALAYSDMGNSLLKQGKPEEAIRACRAALVGHDAGRIDRGRTGFERAQFGLSQVPPRRGLVLAHARLKEPVKAWQYAEGDLARNLLDDLGGVSPDDARLRAELAQLDRQLTPLFGLAKPTEDESARHAELGRQRRDVLGRLAQQAAARSAGQVWSLQQVQKQLPADAAILLWVGGQEETWGCVVRAEGAPRWVPLRGTGKKGVWRKEDYDEPDHLLRALADPRSSPGRRRDLAEAVRRRWFAPLGPHLAAEGARPAVKRLFVVPIRFLAGLPVEVLAPGYTVSYTPSATVLAQSLQGHRALRASPALALGDPTFQPPSSSAAPPAHGVLILTVEANGSAARAGLRPGDILLRYDGAELKSVNDLVAAVKKNGKGKATYWRGGHETTVALPLPLGIRVDRRPAPVAVKAFRAANASATRAETFDPLPGTRAEVQALQRLLGEGCRTLLGSAASEQTLDALAKELKSFRVLHLATHGEVNLARPEHSRLILARDALPTLSESAARASKGLKPFTGELTVDTILNDWKLDADLVVLSACQTGLGAHSSGDGLLGFPYALMRAGARSVVLSSWKVDDTATALLMVRFYENLLGQARGLKGPMGRADALAEAKKWLREQPRKDAERLAAALNANKLSGTRGGVVDLDVKEKPKLPAGDRPYDHPFFWAAFTLIGDPD